jgi:hypothetical protein
MHKYGVKNGMQERQRGYFVLSRKPTPGSVMM